MRRALLALAIWGGCGGQEKPPPPPSPAPTGLVSSADTRPPPPFHFTEETVPTVVWCGRKEKPHLLESGGSGLALAWPTRPPHRDRPDEDITDPTVLRLVEP